MKRFFLLFIFILSLLMGQGTLVVNTSISDDEFSIASIVQLHFNSTTDSLFIQTPGHSYSYVVSEIESIDFGGQLSVFDMEKLTSFNLMQNYPNPFNPKTTIQFDIPKTGKTRVDIFNLKGQLVNTLVHKDLDVGTHQVNWDGRTSSGILSGRGIYIYRVSLNDKQYSRKMVLLK
ncbi:MAG: T9SS type A sorting domain-containing protein [Candidatus Marinimicrobia bacterium]|nr:T9SS type A sorting domain-containing protein [Candidatus Neomarinimicrobiota bacterium]